jgi:hypothetical protein
MTSFIVSIGLVLVAAGAARGATHPAASHPANGDPRLVFAHFHMPYAPNGPSVPGYERDIRDAQAAGLDGFVLNMGAWDGEGGWYKKRTAMMFQAAENLHSGFLLALSPDESGGLSASEHLDMMRTYANRPNYFHWHGRPVLFSWSGEAQGGGVREARDWWLSQVLGPLKKEGIDVFFVPMFYTANYDETPDYANLKANWDGAARDRKGEPLPGWWKGVVDGLYYFAATGLPEHGQKPSVLDTGEAYARLLHKEGRLFMAGVSPLYWGDLQVPGRRYFEYGGGAGLAAQWNSIIHVQKPQWVELFTWTDFTEATYFSPVADPAPGNYSLRTGYGAGWFPTHKGFLELNRYYVHWFKTGKQPPITHDQLFFFYRTHPKDATAPDDPRGPVTDLHGDVEDVLDVTTFLTAPARLRVITGGEVKEVPVGSGIVQTTVPFKPGSQVFELLRGGKRLLQTEGQPILDKIEKYNYSVTSGFANDRRQPDLIVGPATCDPPDPAPGEPVRLKATVTNVGTASTNGLPVTVAFYADDVRVGEGRLDGKPIPAGSAAVVEASAIWSPTAGDRRLQAVVNEANRVPEADLYNDVGPDSTVQVGPGVSVDYFAWEGGPLYGALHPLRLEPGATSFTVPADEHSHVLKVWVGGDHGAGRLSASLSDGSGHYSDGWDAFSNPKGPFSAVYTITYRAAGPGQTLTVEWKRSSPGGEMKIEAAGIQMQNGM